MKLPAILQSRTLARALLVLTALAGPLAIGGTDKGGPRPAISLPVAALGFRPESAAFITARLTTTSLDFIDKDHLLLTFRTSGLLTRWPDTKPGDEDQNIRAVVLELPSGQVIRTADWRMHDHGRYLWPLQNGTFLVRQRDTLYVTDASLELKPYIDLPARLEQVQPSPDGQLLALQIDQERHSKEEHKRLVQQALDADAELPREDVKLLIMRGNSGTILAHMEAARPVDIPLLTDGYLQAIPGKEDHWQLRYFGFSGEKKVFGDVESTCTPTEAPVTPGVFLLITCMARTDDHLVQAVGKDGKILWDFWWESTMIWPSYGSSADGGRFAFSTLKATHSVSALEAIGDDDLKAQRVQIFDVAAGQVVLTVNVSPAPAPGSNFALSPNGRRFAILAADGLQVFDVPLEAPPVIKKKK